MLGLFVLLQSITALCEFVWCFFVWKTEHGVVKGVVLILLIVVNVWGGEDIKGQLFAIVVSFVARERPLPGFMQVGQKEVQHTHFNHFPPLPEAKKSGKRAGRAEDSEASLHPRTLEEGRLAPKSPERPAVVVLQKEELASTSTSLKATSESTSKEKAKEEVQEAPKEEEKKMPLTRRQRKK